MFIGTLTLEYLPIWQGKRNGTGFRELDPQIVVHTSYRMIMLMNCKVIPMPVLVAFVQVLKLK